jgi:predicted nuclease with TOPRIM domain
MSEDVEKLNNHIFQSNELDEADFKPNSSGYVADNEVFKRAVDALGLDDKLDANLTQQHMIELLSAAVDKLADRVDELEDEKVRLEQKIDDVEYEVNSVDQRAKNHFY